MRVLVTGATGFIGTHLVGELIDAGHEVVGLTRSDAGAKALRRRGAQAQRGDVNDLDLLRGLAARSDGVIHAAFHHDFSDLARLSEKDRKVVTALGGVLAGSERPLIVSSGTGLALCSTPGAPVVETDPHSSSRDYPRAATEEAADAACDAGAHVVVMRLAQVHDEDHAGRISEHIALARRHGWVGYIGDGRNRVPAVHVRDAVQLYRSALEHGRSGARYHAVAEEGVALRDIAETVATAMGLPVASIGAEHVPEYFGPLAGIAAADLAASSAATRRELDWHPDGPGLLADLTSTAPHSTEPSTS